MRKLAWVVATLLLVALVAFFTVVAPVVDRRMNAVVGDPLPAVPAEAARQHASLMVVDLHADPLLW